MRHKFTDPKINELAFRAIMLADGIPPSTIDDMTRRDIELYFIGRNKKYEDMIDIIKVGANKGFFGEK